LIEVLVPWPLRQPLAWRDLGRAIIRDDVCVKTVDSTQVNEQTLDCVVDGSRARSDIAACCLSDCHGSALNEHYSVGRLMQIFLGLADNSVVVVASLQCSAQNSQRIEVGKLDLAYWHTYNEMINSQITLTLPMLPPAGVT